MPTTTPNQFGPKKLLDRKDSQRLIHTRDSLTYFVNHIGQHALDFIRVDHMTASHANCSLELGYRYSRTTNWGCLALFWFIKAASNEDLT